MALEYPNYADKVIFVDLLGEGAPEGTAPTQLHLDSWIEDPPIPFTTAMDPPGAPLHIINDFSPIENAFLVELDTMTIVKHVQTPSMLYPDLDAL